MKILLVFLGGGLGAVSRFGLTQLVLRIAPLAFPLGIFLCNVLGSFLIGLGTGLAAKMLTKEAAPWFGPLVLVGFLGGFTTFSTFANDTNQLFREGQTGLAFTNIALSVLASLGAVALGLRLAES